ncbi:hypothetical protein JCM8202v2_001953 [Rhodotorula sphaerocarpa]
MQCAACARSEPQRNGAWYCGSCISSRLQEYHVRKTQLRNALKLVTGNATTLLTGSQTRFGVEHERLLKAEKWSLASRAYASREEVARVKAQNHATAEQLEKRRQALQARRANLAIARSLLSNLDTQAPSATSLSLLESVPALQARCAALQTELDTLGRDTARTRAILARELVSVYGLRRIVVEQPLPDPFLTAPLAHSSLDSDSGGDSSAMTRRRAPPAPDPIPPTYTLASLPLPRLSHLLSALPSTAHVEALLSHLTHLVRLLALYEGIALPFTPLPSCFGPGRAGVRVAVGWGASANSGTSASRSPTRVRRRRSSQGGGTTNEAQPRDGSTSTSTTPIPTPPSGQSGFRALEGDCFPLCFAGRLTGSSRSSRNSPSKRSSATEDGSHPHGSSHDLEEASEHAGLDDSFGAGEKGQFSYREQHDAGSDPHEHRRSSASKRARGVLLGAVVLAYDLAYLAWAREQRTSRAEDPPDIAPDRRVAWQDPNILDDLGELLLSAADVSLDHERRSGQSNADSTALPRPPAPQPHSARPDPFPLSFTDAATHFLELCFPSPRSDKSSHASAGSDSLGESGVVLVGPVPEADEDEWDLVSV